jgi:hypothetical protein
VDKETVRPFSRANSAVDYHNLLHYDNPPHYHNLLHALVGGQVDKESVWLSS